LNWGSGFLPTTYQGVPFRTTGEPILNLTSPKGITPIRQKQTIEAVRDLNAARLSDTGDPEIATRISSYEMAYRMQTSAPELIERGVRFIQLYHTDWDHHGSGGVNLNEGLDRVCKETDQPAAALVRDLKQRGLLDQTLVVWGGEFGRTPMGELRETVGRNHHI